MSVRLPKVATRTERCAIANPHHVPTAPRHEPRHDARAFHRSMPGYEPTPLVDAASLARHLGVAAVHVKDESSRLAMPSFKILGASWATYRALVEWLGADLSEVGGLADVAHRLEGRDVTLVAATDGNHGRAVARMARLLRQSARVLVPRGTVDERIEAIRGEGADVIVVDGNYDEAVARSAAMADDSHLVVSDTSWPGYERTPARVVDGYRTIVAEVLEQLDARGAPPPTVVVVQMGVGALAAAMIRGFSPHGARIVGVEPTAAACVLESIRAGRRVQLDAPLDSIMAGLNCGTPSPLVWPELRDGLRYVTAITDADARVAMRTLAGIGVVSGESGAAGVAALLAHGHALALDGADRVLVISTEGATDRAAYGRILATGDAAGEGAGPPA